jgi:hypothetical protein
MRNFIDAIQITESVDFHPAVLSIRDGEKYIDFPPNGSEKMEKPCSECSDTKYGEFYGRKNICPYCQGTGIETETIYNFPMMNVSNRNMQVVCSLLGVECDDYSGWIPPNEIPTIKRRLIRLMNGDTKSYQIEPTEFKGERKVDRSGDIPRITTGPQMLDFGVDDTQITRYISTLMKILDYAQQNNMGVSWA